MKVLVAGEFSGIVRDAFAARGHNAWSCDLLPSERPAGQHYQGDVREILGEYWDLILAHPDCTYITNSGVRWLMEKDDGDSKILKGARRWAAMWESCEFFRIFLEHPCHRIVIENPVPHKYAARWIGKPYSMSLQPWQYGHQDTKRTCLWLKNLPKLKPTKIMPPPYNGTCHEESPGDDRWMNRSRTYQGIADALAEQYGGRI